MLGMRLPPWMAIKCASPFFAIFSVWVGSAPAAQATDACTVGQVPTFCVQVLNIRHPRYLYFYIHIPSWTAPVPAGVGVTHWNVQDPFRPKYEVRRYGTSNRSKRAYARTRSDGSTDVQIQLCLRLDLATGASSCGPWYSFALKRPVSRRVDSKKTPYYAESANQVDRYRIRT